MIKPWALWLGVQNNLVIFFTKCHPLTSQSTTPAWARTSPSRPSCRGGGRRWVWEPCPCGTAWPGCPPRWPLPALCHPAAEPRLLWSPHSPRMLPEIWTHRCLVTLVTPFTLTRAHTHAHTHFNDVRKYMHIHKESERLRTSQIITLFFFYVWNSTFELHQQTQDTCQTCRSKGHGTSWGQNQVGFLYSLKHGLLLIMGY